MTYNEAMTYMEQVQKKGSVLGLESIRELLKGIGNPQDKLQVIHVAGTNGKGSICTFLENLYRAEGKKVGRYISPTIHSYLERFQIDGANMSEEQFALLLSSIMDVILEMEQTPTAFEIETAIAFAYFLNEQVDIVILETGMGGRLDATNVICKPLCTVFAAIGMDHMQFLGDTIEEIAAEKAGIMKKGCPVVSYPNKKEVMQVLKNVYYEINEDKSADFVTVDSDAIEILWEGLNGSRFCYKGVTYNISMCGTYQIYNAVTAIETKMLLDGKVMKEGLIEASWEGRFEKISEEPLFIRDGAHNVDGVWALRESVEKHFTNYRILFIIGVLGDKEYENMMEILCPMAEEVFTITPQNDRGLSGEKLAGCVKQYCSNVMACENVEAAISSAKKAYKIYRDKNEKAVIIAWGSLSYIGQINRV